MLAQMAATAGSVAIGSTIGHGISSMLFGGGGHSSAPVEQQQAPAQQAPAQQWSGGLSCETQAKGTMVFVSLHSLSGADVAGSVYRLYPMPREG